MFANFPDVLLSHVCEAYRAARKLADPDDIQLLRMPYTEHLFMQFRKYTENKDISVVYHGTGAEVLDSIVTYGMLDPTSPMYKVKNGNAYGPGVYVSPNPNFSISYMGLVNNIKNSKVANPINPKGCILVLLAIKGTQAKAADINISSTDINSAGINSSHVSGTNFATLDCDYYHPNSNIIVLRSTSQVLPIFACKKINKSNVILTDEQCLRDIGDMQANIVLDDKVLELSLELQAKYNRIADQSDSNNIKLGVIYNLFMKKMCLSKIDTLVSTIRDTIGEDIVGETRTIDVIKNSTLEKIYGEVEQMLNDFDYSDVGSD